MINEDYGYPTRTNDGVNFRDLIHRYLRHWKWFAMTTIAALVIAKIYLSFSTPIYQSVATIIIKDEENSGSSNQNNDFMDLGFLGGIGTNSIENELGLLRSQRLMTNAIKALDLNVQYFKETTFGLREVYDESPFKVDILSLDERALEEAILEEENIFNISNSSKDILEIKNRNTSNALNSSIGSLIELGYVRFKVERNPNYVLPLDSNAEAARQIVIGFATTKKITSTFQSSLQAWPIEENATLISLSLEDPLQLRAQDILNQLVFEYNREAIEDKKLIAENTAFFIDERLSIINKELDSVESGKESFKESNRLTDIGMESSIIMQNASEYNIKQEEVSTKLELVKAMSEFLQSNTSNLLPSNIGVGDSGIDQVIKEYNQLIIERDRLLAGSTDQNPGVVKLNNQIDQLKNNLRVSLDRVRTNLRISKSNLQRQAGIIGSQIAEVPAQEREFRGIERQQNIKEALYLFLLQKREENSLSLAATAPKAKIVDEAHSYDDPVKPNSSTVMFVSLLLGLALPFFYINLIGLLNNKVKTRSDLKKLSDSIPILGEIPHVSDAANHTVQQNDRSVVSEAFRVLTTNLPFHSNKERMAQKGISIFVTSSIKGEGKTFTAINLAMTFANANLKVVVVGADLRNPQLHRYEKNVDHHLGLTHYLSTDTLEIEQLLEDSNLHPNLKLFLSGRLPKNPSELLRSEKVGILFSRLKELFDYVIVDCPPSMPLADIYLINEYADRTLYVLRAGYTEKRILDFIEELDSNNKLKNMGFVLNDVDVADIGYSSMYGYNDLGHEKTFLGKLRSAFT